MHTSRSRISVADRTLADQLQITEREIEYRKSLLGLSGDALSDLTECHDYVLDKIEEIVGRFYAVQLRTPEFGLLIGDAETLQRLQASMRRYILELFEGYYDEQYVNKRLRIGKIHMRIGVSPKLYIAAITLLDDLLLEYVRSDPSVGGDEGAIARRGRRARLIRRPGLNAAGSASRGRYRPVHWTAAGGCGRAGCPPPSPPA